MRCWSYSLEPSEHATLITSSTTTFTNDGISNGDSDPQHTQAHPCVARLQPSWLQTVVDQNRHYFWNHQHNRI